MDEAQAQPLDPGTPEYEDGLVEQFDSAQGTQTEQQPKKAERPADVPEKFWDAENGTVKYDELLRSYRELERSRSQPQEEPDADLPEDEEGAAEALEQRGLDFDKFADSFQRNGALTEDDYADLADAGIPRELVDMFIEGQVAKMETFRGEMFNLVGGEETYQSMAQWASQTLSQAELNAYNQAVDSGDEGLARIAIQGLHARYAAENGSDPKLLGGAQSAATGSTYRSTQELMRDMSNPLYESDPAFRADVEAKLARSSIF